MSYRAEVLATNPLAYWRLGEAAGTVAVDEKGAYNGTYVNAPTLGVAGLVAGSSNTAVGFVAASSHHATAQLASSGDLTVACWVRTTAAVLQLALSADGGATPWWIGTQANGTSRFACGTASIVGPVVNNGVARLLVATISGTAVKLYVDRASAGTGTLAAARALSLVPTYVGGRGDGFYFNGTIDEPAIWNRALSAAEITKLYDEGSGAAARERLAAGVLMQEFFPRYGRRGYRGRDHKRL